MAHAARNAKINGGIMRFSRSTMYHKKAAFVKNKKAEKAPVVKKVGLYLWTMTFVMYIARKRLQECSK